MILTSSLLDAFEIKFGDGVWLSKGGSEVNVRCPYCIRKKGTPDLSGHLGLNPEKNVAHCFRCGWSNKDLRGWLEGRGFDAAASIRFGQAADVPTLKNRAHKLRADRDEVVFVMQEVKLPEGVVPLTECDNPEYVNSLLSKGLEFEEMEDLFACTRRSGPNEDYSGYVIFPFWETGDLVFWQGRDIWKRKLRKINPATSEKMPLGKGAWLYGYDDSKGKKGGTCWLSEGALDQKSLRRWIRETQTGDLQNGHYAWALQGSTLTFPDENQHPLNSQFGKLAILAPSQINVVLDDDAFEKSKALADLLQRCGFNANAIRLEGGDPNKIITSEGGVERFTNLVEGSKGGHRSLNALSQKLKSINR